MHKVPGAAYLLPQSPLGVTIRCEASLDDIMMQRGVARGVVVAHSDGDKTAYRARRGVVLASGDFAANREIRARYQAVVNAEPVYKYNTGDPLLIAERLGARIVSGDGLLHSTDAVRSSAQGELGVAPAVLEGGRTADPDRLECNASSHHATFHHGFVTPVLGPQPNLFKQGAAPFQRPRRIPRRRAWQDRAPSRARPQVTRALSSLTTRSPSAWAWRNFISTAPRIAYAYLRDYPAARRDIYFAARSIAALAARIGADPATMQASIAAHNQHRGEVGRSCVPPFIALGPVRGYINAMEGGLAVNYDLAVLGANDQPIPGLFAAGSAGQGGVLLDGHGHHIAWACVSGRHAARNALAANAPD